jgi:hypothetical protein
MRSLSLMSNNHNKYRDSPSIVKSSQPKCIRRSLLRKNRYKKPYEVPWRLTNQTETREDCLSTTKRDKTLTDCIRNMHIF